jgi:hypothetical protein
MLWKREVKCLLGVRQSKMVGQDVNLDMKTYKLYSFLGTMEYLLSIPFNKYIYTLSS